MFKWLSNKIVENYIKSKIKEIKKKNIKEKLLEYFKEHKEELIAKVFKAIETLIQNLVKKNAEELEDKAEE